jgi:CubicO group peptidase (beta-lactamase class C family)
MPKAVRTVAAVLLVATSTLATVAFAILSLHESPTYAWRLVRYGRSDTGDHRVFPSRAIDAAPTPSPLPVGAPSLPESITWPTPTGAVRTEALDDLLRRTGTKAFLVAHRGALVLERYGGGAARDDVQTSFSTAKSFLSALVGAAVADGLIASIDDPVVRYVPEISGRGLDDLTIRHLMTMSSGIRYRSERDLPAVMAPLSDDALTYYAADLRRVALRVEHDGAPAASTWRYNNYHPLLEGLILERATGMPVARYLQERLWIPMGAEFPASWSLDSDASGFEKMESGFNARPVDYLRFGLVYLNGGAVNGRQVLPAAWVTESTAPPAVADARTWPPGLEGFRRDGGYYGFHWWGFELPDGTYEFSASGQYGQYVYVAPWADVVIVRLGDEVGGDPVAWNDVFREIARVIAEAGWGRVVQR